VDPWLLSALCVGIAYYIQGFARLNTIVAFGLAAISGWVVLRTGPTPEAVALAAGCLLILMATGIAANSSKRGKIVQAITWAWLLAAATSTAIALCQYFGATDHFAPWINGAAAGEAFANLRQRNQFASLTVIGMASLIWFVPAGIKPWPVLLSMAWLAVGNAATTSRTGLAQMFVLVILARIWPDPLGRRVAVSLAGLMIYFLAALALPWLLEVATGTAGNHLWDRVAAADSCTSRTVLWSNVLHLIAQKPWLGWGWGELDFAHYMTLYDGPRFCDILDNAHNLPLHLAVELGIPAAVLVCGALLWAIARAKPWRESCPTRQMAWAVLAVLGIHSLLEYPLWYGPFQIAFGLCLGLLWPSKNAQVQQGMSAPARVHTAAAVLSACVAAACAYAAWDYRRVSQIYLPAEARAEAYRDDPLPKIRRSWLFHNQAAFAELTITPLTEENARWTFDSANALLHYSPEPRVIEKLIDSAVILGRHDEVLLHLARFRAAFPQAYAAWSQDRLRQGAGPQL
jgi:O-antigen ligase